MGDHPGPLGDSIIHSYIYIYISMYYADIIGRVMGYNVGGVFAPKLSNVSIGTLMVNHCMLFCTFPGGHTLPKTYMKMHGGIWGTWVSSNPWA